MKRTCTVIIILTIGAVGFHFNKPSTTTISVAIGDTFNQVVKASSYSVKASSDIPSNDEIGFGTTWVKKPAVIIQFDDPKFGFNLPPTTLAAVGYMHNKVDNITTSPMLEVVSFTRALEVMISLQKTFQQRGWELDDDTKWFDLSAAGQEILRATLREHGHWISLRAPGKYSMFFGLYCFKRCDSSIGLDRYLIDISIGRDFESDIQERERTDAGNLY